MVGVSFPLCVVCKKEVNFRQHALCCDNCNRWQHRLCDSGITYQDYRGLTQGEVDIVWHCAACPTANRIHSPQTLTKDIDVILNLKDKVAITDLPPGWKKKKERKSQEPNGKQIIYYISPNGRRFDSKESALEFCELHYQENGDAGNIAEDKEVFVTLSTLKDLADTCSPITAESEKDTQNSKIASTHDNDKNPSQLFTRLLTLNENNEKNKKFQPYIHLQRLSPFTILRETNQTKPFVKIDGISDDKNIQEDVQDIVLEKRESDKDIKSSFVKEENNNKVFKNKKKRQKLNTRKDTRHSKTTLIDFKTNKNKNPMKVKAQLNKHSMNISLKIDRKSLKIDPTYKIQIKNEDSLENDSSENRLNLKLGTAKVKNKGKNLKKDILKNIKLQNDVTESEMSVGKTYNHPNRLMSSAENATLSTSHVRPLVWLHISPKDIEFGLIS